MGTQEGNHLGYGEPHNVLSLSPNVEQAGTGSKGHRKTTQDKGDGVVEGLSYVAHVHLAVVDIVPREGL